MGGCHKSQVIVDQLDALSNCSKITWTMKEKSLAPLMR